MPSISTMLNGLKTQNTFHQAWTLECVSILVIGIATTKLRRLVYLIVRQRWALHKVIITETPIDTPLLTAVTPIWLHSTVSPPKSLTTHERQPIKIFKLCVWTAWNPDQWFLARTIDWLHLFYKNLGCGGQGSVVGYYIGAMPMGH